jgi:branched-chain amino acid transport system permease protein
LLAGSELELLKLGPHQQREGCGRSNEDKMTAQEIIMQILSGLSMGMGLFVVAAGLVFVFGSLKILNFAHGNLYMLGAYLSYTIISFATGLEGRFWIALILAPVIVGLVGGAMELIAIRRTYGQHVLYQLLLTFGFIWIIDDVCKLAWGSAYYAIYPPSLLQGPIFIFGLGFPLYNIFVMFSGFFIFFAMYLFLSKTKWGAIIRAITTDRDMANTLGYNVPRIYTLMFMMGCYLGGFGGAILAPMGNITPGMGMHIILICFIITVMGGFGSLGGAMIAAIIIGLVQSFGIVFFPKAAVGLPYILLTITLILRPHGIMGKRIII